MGRTLVFGLTELLGLLTKPKRTKPKLQLFIQT